jgi:hypothetical protein
MNIWRFASQAELSILWALRICCVGIAVGTLELLYRQQNLLHHSGLMSWEGLSMSRGLGKPPFVVRCLTALMFPRVFQCILLVRFAGALLLAMTALVVFSRIYMLLLTIVVLLSTFIHHFRLPIGTDGSDHMNAIVLMTGSVTLLLNKPEIYVLGALFIALQLFLSYEVAGIAKAFSIEWRSGASTPSILSTWTYGWPPIGEFLRNHSRLCQLIDWGVIGFELLFPLGVLLPGRACILVLLVGVIFHFFNAVIMGLNTFFWAFTSGYPPMFFAASLFRGFRG